MESETFCIGVPRFIHNHVIQSVGWHVGGERRAKRHPSRLKRTDEIRTKCDSLNFDWLLDGEQNSLSKSP